MAAAALKPAPRKSRTSTSGCSVRRACTTNATTAASPTTSGTHALGASSVPCDADSLRPKTIAATPGDSNNNPTRSSGARSCPASDASPAARAFGSSCQASASPTMPIGRLT